MDKGGQGQPHLVQGFLNAGPRAGVVTRLACMCIAVYKYTSSFSSGLAGGWPSIADV